MKGDIRTIRDPIQNDIRLSGLAAAVVDTRIFQRLRYIRQNGLLHFVFPGAVHTRFSHSLGTMSLANRVMSQLLGDLVSGASDEIIAAIRYCSTVFELAALLHDVGHCAFSHSIESAVFKGKPLFGSLRERFEAWGEQELLTEYLEAHSKKDPAENPVTHEQLGLAFVRLIFNDERVATACKRELDASTEDVGRDVRAIMSGALRASDIFRAHVVALEPHLRDQVLDLGAEDEEFKLKQAEEDLLIVFHDLVSGTLDVDRLDYLRRDSFHCGVPYGICDTDILIGSLRLGVIAGRLYLLLHERAARALEDMLWSRYQLFVQVLNHKTNVGLNSLLSVAIEDAIKDVRFPAPTSVDDFVEFTDDYVMSRVFSPVIKGELKSKSYAMALVDRRLPLHLGSEPFPVDGDMEARRLAKVAELKLHDDELFAAEAKSEFIKAGELPKIVSWNKLEQKPIARRWDETESSAVPMTYHRVHFFAERK